MKCKAIVTYKGIEQKEGGEFITPDNRKVKYEGSYVVKFDEITDSGAIERKAKFKLDNVGLFTRFKGLKIYEKIEITFDLVFSNNNSVRLVPTDFALAK